MRNIFLIIIVIIYLISFGGCTSSPSNPNIEYSTTSEDELVVNHFNGTTIVRKHPKRIVVLDYSVLDNMNSLNVDIEAIGTCTQYLPQYIKDMDTKTEIVDIGNLKNVNLEAIYNFHPDLIIINGRQLKYYDKLSKIAPTINTSAMSKYDYKEALKNNITLIGKIFDKEISSLALYETIETRISKINSNPNINDKGLFLFIVGNKMFVVNSESMMGGLPYNACRLNSVTDNQDTTKKNTPYTDQISFEYIASKNPEYIVIINKDAAIHLGTAKTTSFITDNVLLQNVDAVKNNRVYLANSEVWYLAGGGYGSANIILNEIEQILNNER